MKQRSLRRAALLAWATMIVGACSERQPLDPPTAVSLPGSRAITDGPTMVDDDLEVRTVVSGLVTPIAIAFLDRDDDDSDGRGHGSNDGEDSESDSDDDDSDNSGRGNGQTASRSDMFVIEKNTGRVLRVTNGAVTSVVLDLAVNNASERGLLGIALDPEFPRDPAVYLYWTESTTGSDAEGLADTPLLGNRVDRFIWNGSTLVLQRNVIRLRAFQEDAGQPLRGNHDGGMIRFGPDRKLYVFIGDVGRRGNTQNLRCGPTTTCPPVVPDDQFGGPAPDDAHLTGVVLRLNEDGTAPRDNPFFSAGAAMGDEVGKNVQKIFSYGHRNSIGMAFHPRTGDLWLEENGDDSFTELNRVERGMNGGWVQFAGPVSRIAQFKAIETSPQFFGLQQIRWSPENTANTPQEALSRLFVLPGSRYVDPEFSWKFEVAPAGVGFIEGDGLGGKYQGDLVIGAARTTLENGHLFRFRLSGSGRRLQFDDPRLQDRVADNLGKFDITESETLLFGRNFGIGSDIQSGPKGRLYVVSLDQGAVYEISRKR
jgi:glucose/arabinose dehydrogenase